MNCEDYRKAIAAGPSESVDGGAEHVAACASCRAYRDEMLRLDEKIRAALAVDVPPLRMPDLPPVRDDQNVVSLPRTRRPRMTPPAWLGLAAGLVLAVVIGDRMFGPGQTYDSLADEVIAHLDHEPGALRRVSTPVSERSLRAVIEDDVEEMNEAIGLITYARSCVINGRTVPHLVMQGAAGPITLLLLPDEHVDNAIPLQGENVNGVILPVGDGSIAIIGEREERLDEIEQRVIDSVRWKT
jgi:hypothetical protein